jgi:putative membrane protein
MWNRDDHMDGGWWWVMGIGWLLFLLLIVVLGYLLIRHFTQGGGARPERSTAEGVLDERFARGEIDEEEYRRRRDALRG